MDIIGTIGIERRYTFHSHTQFCDGRAPMSEFARAAAEAGFRHYGFSPHSPVPISSPCNMKRESVDEYLEEVSRANDTYGDRVRFYAGMEIDYLGAQWGPANEYFDNIPLDFRIGSVHFIADREGYLVDIDGSFESFKRKMAEHFNGDIRYVVETFYCSSAAMIEAGGFDILGHFDKVAQNASYWQPGIEDEHWYISLVDDLIRHICDRKPIVEINTKAHETHGRIFPSERYLPRLVEARVPMIVNSDAHVPALIDASREYAFRLLDDLCYDPRIFIARHATESANA